MELGLQMFIERVPTKENISDDPSRERYSLLKYMGVRVHIACQQAWAMLVQMLLR